MSRNLDAQALLMACMADLGRERQEELPLSNKVMRGPTFMPGRGTGVGHIAPQLRQKLSQGWNTKIDDGESKQMEGLDIEDSRPWARHRVQDNQHISVKPATRQRIAENSKLKAHGAASVATVQIKTCTSEELQRYIKTETRTVSEISTSDKDQQYTLCRGQCKLVNSGHENSALEAEFSLRANLTTNCGFLVVKPLRGNEVMYDVLDLDCPTVNGAMCTVPWQHTKGAVPLNLSFQKSDEAQDFQHYLKSLQASAAHASSRVGKLEESEKTLTDMSQIQQTEPSQRHGSSSQDTVLTSTIIPSQDVIDKPSDMEPVENLIEFDETPYTEDFAVKPVYGGIFEDAALRPFDVVKIILRDCFEGEGSVLEETLQKVEEVVFKNWAQMAPTEFGDGDDIREDLRLLLRSSINIKLKTDVRQRKMLHLASPAIAALQNDVAPQKRTERIQYTAAEMLDCRISQDKKTSGGLQSSRWAKSSPLNAAAAAFEPLEISSFKTSQMMEISRDAQQNSINKPVLEGLSTSRWAH